MRLVHGGGDAIPCRVETRGVCDSGFAAHGLGNTWPLAHHFRPGNGFLVPPRDAIALEGAIRLLLGDSGLRGRMARRGREIAKVEFSEELVIRETVRVYKELIGDRWPDAR